LASIASIPDSPLTATLVFRVGASRYGCDLRVVQEIIPFRAATRLPGAPPYVLGLINVRGTIVTVMDLGNRLDPSRAPAREGAILLARHRERLVGVVVDQVADVRTLDADAQRATDAGGAIVNGVATLDDGAVVVLDLEALVKQVLLS